MPDFRLIEHVDVLAVIAKHRDSHKALASSDAYSAQEAPKLNAAFYAVADLMHWVRKHRDSCTLQTEREAKDGMYAALDRASAATGEQP